MIGGLANSAGPDHVQVIIILEESFSIEGGYFPCRAIGCMSHLLKLVLTVIAISGQMPDIGDIHYMIYRESGNTQGSF